MTKAKKQLLLKIEQSGTVVYHRLAKNDRISIGQHPDNDVTVYGEQFPQKHILFFRKNNHFQISLKNYMKGEVIAGNSRLTFKDMLVHNLLPKRGDSFYYPITLGKKGIVLVGDAKITFQCTDGDVQSATASMPKFIGFSWAYATFREFGRDLHFKAILLLLIILHAFMLKYMSGLPTDIIPKFNARQVPERLAKIIVKKPEPAITENRTGSLSEATAEEAEEGASEEAKRNRAEKSSKGVRPENQGVLGLLTGMGSTGQSSNLADFLLDKGLAKELDQVMSSTDLQIGQGMGNSDDLDDLIATSELGGGIDDILDDIDDIESVSLGEKGRIQVDRIGDMTGSENALGKRSEDSVRSVMLSYSGRLTYIYNKYLKRSPALKGKMVVEVVIAASGVVASVKLVSSTMNHPDFEREVLNFMRNWKYEAIDQGSVTVTYPLFFNKIE